MKKNRKNLNLNSFYNLFQIILILLFFASYGCVAFVKNKIIIDEIPKTNYDRAKTIIEDNKIEINVEVPPCIFDPTHSKYQKNTDFLLLGLPYYTTNTIKKENIIRFSFKDTNNKLHYYEIPSKVSYFQLFGIPIVSVALTKYALDFCYKPSKHDNTIAFYSFYNNLTFKDKFLFWKDPLCFFNSEVKRLLKTNPKKTILEIKSINNEKLFEYTSKTLKEDQSLLFSVIDFLKSDEFNYYTPDVNKNYCYNDSPLGGYKIELALLSNNKEFYKKINKFSPIKIQYCNQVLNLCQVETSNNKLFISLKDKQYLKKFDDTFYHNYFKLIENKTKTDMSVERSKVNGVQFFYNEDDKLIIKQYVNNILGLEKYNNIPTPEKIKALVEQYPILYNEFFGDNTLFENLINSDLSLYDLTKYVDIAVKGNVFSFSRILSYVKKCPKKENLLSMIHDPQFRKYQCSFIIKFKNCYLKTLEDIIEFDKNIVSRYKNCDNRIYQQKTEKYIHQGGFYHTSIKDCILKMDVTDIPYFVKKLNECKYCRKADYYVSEFANCNNFGNNLNINNFLSSIEYKYILRKLPVIINTETNKSKKSYKIILSFKSKEDIDIDITFDFISKCRFTKKTSKFENVGFFERLFGATHKTSFYNHYACGPKKNDRTKIKQLLEKFPNSHITYNELLTKNSWIYSKLSDIKYHKENNNNYSNDVKQGVKEITQSHTNEYLVYCNNLNMHGVSSIVKNITKCKSIRDHGVQKCIVGTI